MAKDNVNSIENVKKRIESENSSRNNLLYMCLCFCAVALLGLLGNWEEKLMGIVFIFPTYYLVQKLIKQKSMEKEYMDYISMILIHGETSIQKMANQLNSNYEKALDAITQIISKNYIVGYKINKSNKTVVYDDESQTTRQDSSTSADKCTRCGGNLFDIVDGVKYCKYCGSKV